MKKLSLLLLLFFFSFFSFAGGGRHARKSRTKAVSRAMAFPVAGRRSDIEGFWGDNRDGGRRLHKGIDIYARKGTPVIAISDGIIIKKANTKNGGKTLWLKPTNYEWKAYYAHLDKQLVKRGQKVRKGQVIGTVGNTGNAITTASHLHFGISPGKGWVNPLPYVKHSPKVAAPKMIKGHNPAKRKRRR